MRIALICDWLTGMRGGERCLEAVCELYPDADIFTLVYFPGTASEIIESHNIHTSYIQRLPGNKDAFRRYLPLFPNTIERFNLSGYELVLSFSHCVAKGVKVCRNVPHICYCHTPMRYAWFMRDEYLSSFGSMKRWVADKLLDYLKNWDRRTSAGVTHFIANSKNVQNRIKQAYNRDSTVIYPPVDHERFTISGEDGGYYLVVSALVPYKRVDLAVSAFKGLNQKLLIVGNGSESNHLKRIASKNVSFIDRANDNEIAEYMKKSKALIFPGEEDFGIVPLEAQACGKPVIAFGKGGALETVIGLEHNQNQTEKAKATGIFFSEQNPLTLQNAILRFERIRNQFRPRKCRDNAIRFTRSVYQRSMKKYIETVMAEF